MVNEQPRKKTKTPDIKKRSSGNQLLQEAGISQEEANELMNHEKTLMD
jgi:hypothetical protein